MKEKPLKLIRVSGSIVVQKDSTLTFNYFSDLRLDKTWRKEINQTTLNKNILETGIIATEDSFLSKRVPNHKAVLICKAFTPGKSVEFESVPENKFYLKSSRNVTALPNGNTRIDYAIAFDPAVVKHGLGFGLPQFFIKYYTKITLQKYLKQLKRKLEAAQN